MVRFQGKKKKEKKKTELLIYVVSIFLGDAPLHIPLIKN